MLPLLIGEFKLNYFEAGLVSTCTTVAYCGLQYPIGYLADRFGKRNVMVFGQLWSAMVCLMILWVADFRWLLVLLTLLGVGNGMHFIPSAALISDFFTPAKRGRALSIYYSAQAISLIAAPVFAVPLGEAYNWRIPFAVVASFEVIVALLLFKVVKEPPKRQSNLKTSRVNPVNRRSLKIGLLSHMTGYIFATTGFVPTFVSRRFELNLYEAGLIYSTLSVALIVSSWSTLSSQTIAKLKAKKAIVLSEALAFVSTAAMALTSNISTMVAVLLVQGMMRSIMVPAILNYATTVTRPETRATEMGFINTLWVLGSVIGPSMIGFLTDIVGFEWAFLAVSITPLASVALTMTLTENEEA